MNFTSIGKITPLALIIFIVLAVFVKGYEPSSAILTLLSVSTFLFGVFGAFITQDRYARLNSLRSVLRSDDAYYASIYKLSDAFGKNVKRRTQKLIDDYITKTIDYKLVDYNKADKEFLALYEFVVSLNPKNSREKEIYDKLLGYMGAANTNRASVGYMIRNKMQKYEWFSLVGLLASVVFIVFYINDGSLSSMIISVLVSTASVMLLLVIRELDSLRWKEHGWIWEPLEDLFSDLDLLPYYPAEVISEGRAVPKKGTKMRIAYYPRPYPDFTGKKVVIASSGAKVMPSKRYFPKNQADL